MVELASPSSVLYGDLKSFGRLSYRDSARELLSPRPVYGGISPRARMGERTFFSRQIVHARPGDLTEEYFADFSRSTLNLAARIATNLEQAAAGRSAAPARDTAAISQTYRIIAAHYLGQAADEMRDSLESFGLDGGLYANAVANIGRIPLGREEDRAILALMLFVATGCLSSSGRAIQITEEFMKSSLATSFRTTELGSAVTSISTDAQPDRTHREPWADSGALAAPTPSDPDHDDGRGPDRAAVARPPRLGLVRLINGAMRPTIHPLSEKPEGTVIGSLASGDSRIIDVGQTASRQHLRIWRDAPSGSWLCIGLKSTNGTLLMRPDGESIVVEPPHSRRPRDYRPTPVALHAGDTLRLGTDTFFMAVPVAV